MGAYIEFYSVFRPLLKVTFILLNSLCYLTLAPSNWQSGNTLGLKNYDFVSVLTKVPSTAEGTRTPTDHIESVVTYSDLSTAAFVESPVIEAGTQSLSGSRSTILS
jgi:hypothetical protein